MVFNVYQARNGRIYLSGGQGCTYTSLTLQQVVDLGLDVYSLDDFSLDLFKKAYPGKSLPAEERTAVIQLEQAVGAMLEKQVIRFTAFSWCFGMVDMTVESEVFTDLKGILSVAENDWNGGPKQCVAKALARAILAGEFKFIPCAENIAEDREDKSI